jgi:hypothetical protein
MPWHAFDEDEDESRDSTTDRSLHPPLKICFGKRCKEAHAGKLRVNSGKLQQPDDLKLIIFKLAALFLAIITPTIALIYIHYNYFAPKGWQRKLGYPIWLAVGDVVSIYLLYSDPDASDFQLVWIWLKGSLGQKLSGREKGWLKAERKGWRHPAIWLACILAGFGVACWYFYLAAVQILEYGDCRRISILCRF